MHSLAMLIGKGEQLDGKTQEILEAAAVLHDIGIHEAERKHGSDYFWKTNSFIASKNQELQIELPVRLEPLSEHDEGYTVCQAEGDNIFVDLHSESLYLHEDRARYMQDGPQKRVLKIIEKYNVQNAEMTHQQTELVNHIPCEDFILPVCKKDRM